MISADVSISEIIFILLFKALSLGRLSNLHKNRVIFNQIQLPRISFKT